MEFRHYMILVLWVRFIWILNNPLSILLFLTICLIAMLFIDTRIIKIKLDNE